MFNLESLAINILCSMSSFRSYNRSTLDPLIKQLDSLLTDFDFIRICRLCGITNTVREVNFYKEQITIQFDEIKCMLVIDEAYNILLNWTTSQGRKGTLEIEESYKRKIWDYIANKIALRP